MDIRNKKRVELKRVAFVFVSIFVLFLLVSFVSAARLPTVGGDTDSWGAILNNYLTKLAGPNATALNVSGDATFNQNISVLGNINTLNNISANYFIGDGSQLTGVQLNGLWTNSSGNAIYLTGNVGVGMASPTSKLNVNGSINATGTIYSNNNPVLTSYTETDPLAYNGTLAYNSSLGNYYLANNPNGYYNSSDFNISGYVPYTGATSDLNLGNHNLIVNGSTFFVDSATGNVGIGTTNPTSKLFTAGSITANNFIASSGLENSTFKSMLGSGKLFFDKLGQYYDFGSRYQFVDEDLNPTGIHHSFLIHSTGLGDNTNYRGVDALKVVAVDDTSVTNNTKGVLYAIHAAVIPRIARDNVPYDDVDGIAISNEGDYKGTDALYFSTRNLGHSEWSTEITLDADADTGINFGGAFTSYGIDMVGVGGTASYPSGKVFRIPNDKSIVAQNYAKTNDISLLKLDTSDNININNKLYIAPSGNIGIGTATPQNTLNIIGDGNITGNLYVNGELMGGNTTFVPYTGATLDLDLGNHNLTAGNSAFFVDSATGDVGIGTITPQAILDIGNYTDWINPALRFSNPKGRDIRILNDNTGLSIKDFNGTNGTIFNVRTLDDTQRFVIKNSGNVGIGTVTPNYLLDVNGPINSADKITASNSTGVIGGGFSFTQDGGQDTGMFSPSDGVIDFYNNNAKTLTLDSSGNVAFVGTGKWLSLSGDPNTEEGNIDGLNALYGMNDLQLYGNTTGILGITIQQNGNVGIGKVPNYQLELSTDSAAKPSTNTWTVASDRRIKKNINYLTNYSKNLNWIKNFPDAITYNYNNLLYPKLQNITNYGFIAQDLKAYAPNMTTTRNTTLTNGTSINLISINTNELDVRMLPAMKELIKENENLKKEINNLSIKLNSSITGNYTNGNCWTAYSGGIISATNCSLA